MKRITAIALLLVLAVSLNAQVLNLPARNPAALNGTQFIATINSPNLSLTSRENMIYAQISTGNVPAFFRTLVPVTSTAVISGVTQSLTYYVAPDYLMVGCDTDYFLCPMSPMLATKIADLTGCTLPTRKMVNDIYGAATVKLSPSTIPPSNQMTTVPIFAQENTTIRGQRKAVMAAHPMGELTGGDKKDVVISNKIYLTANRVVIYGWHQSVGNPIQPMTNVHADTYMDYSHGIRLIQNAVVYNGNATTVKAVLQSSTLNTLLSDEGSMTNPWYPYGITTGVEESNTPVADLRLYPNPVISNATVEFNLAAAEQVSLEVYDLSGRLAATVANRMCIAGLNQISFDRGTIPKGLYLLTLRSASLSQTLRFVVAD
jgi:hypothetical protein